MKHSAKPCAHQGCRNNTTERRKTGLCSMHYHEARRAKMRRCTECDGVMKADRKCGLCTDCLIIARRAALKACRVCSRSLANSNITGLCAEHLREHKPDPLKESAPFAVHDLIEAAVFYTGVKRDAIIGTNRIALFIRIRAAIYMAAKPYFSSVRISAVVGGRHHATVLNGFKYGEKHVDDERFQRMVKGIVREATLMTERRRVGSSEMWGIAA